MISVILPVASMRMKALGANGPFSLAAASAEGTRKPTHSAPPTLTLASMNARRVSPRSTSRSARFCARLAITVSPSRTVSLSARLRGFFDCLANACIGTAPTDVACHRRIDVGIVGVRRRAEQRAGGHDLSRLTVAALHDLHVEPRLLYATSRRRAADALDGRDVPLADVTDRKNARSNRDAVQVHGAGTALCNAATKFGARHPEEVPQSPK